MRLIIRDALFAVLSLYFVCLLREAVIHQPVEVHPLVRSQFPGLGHDRLQPLQGLLLHHRGAVPGVDLPVPGAHPLQNVQVRVRELVTDAVRAVYDSLAVRQTAERVVASYFDEARQVLRSLRLSEERLAPLRELSDMLLNRRK